MILLSVTLNCLHALSAGYSDTHLILQQSCACGLLCLYMYSYIVNFLVSLPQANCIDSTAEPTKVFAEEIKKLQADKLKPQEQLTLEPYERDHAVVVGVFRYLIVHLYSGMVNLPQPGVVLVQCVFTLSYCQPTSTCLYPVWCWSSVCSHRAIVNLLQPASTQCGVGPVCVPIELLSTYFNLSQPSVVLVQYVFP